MKRDSRLAATAEVRGEKLRNREMQKKIGRERGRETKKWEEKGRESTRQ